MTTEKPPKFRSGYVTILGKPNSGKSTLLNALVGEKIAIVSNKPQTTRDRITGIVSGENYQIIFVDTPGIIVPEDRFNEALMSRAAEALEGIDVIYHLVDITDKDPPNERLIQLLSKAKSATRFLVMNKSDRLRSPAQADPASRGLNREQYKEAFLISAMKRTGVDQLLRHTVQLLPEGPMYYDPEQLTDRDERFLAAEIVREKVFRRTGAEVPYSVYTEIDAFEERPGKDYIRILIYVERESQKGILIGEGGRTLKEIGKDARLEIERLTNRPAFLELHVKVRKDWRKKEYDLNSFGFKSEKKRPRSK